MAEKPETTMKRVKRTLCTLAATLLLMGTASAQIFEMEDKDGRNSVNEIDDYLGIVPSHSSPDEQPNYVPVGSGMLFLMVMGGAYALKKGK